MLLCVAMAERVTQLKPLARWTARERRDPQAVLSTAKTLAVLKDFAIRELGFVPSGKRGDMQAAICDAIIGEDASTSASGSESPSAVESAVPSEEDSSSSVLPSPGRVPQTRKLPPVEMREEPHASTARSSLWYLIVSLLIVGVAVGVAVGLAAVSRFRVTPLSTRDCLDTSADAAASPVVRRMASRARGAAAGIASAEPPQSLLLYGSSGVETVHEIARKRFANLACRERAVLLNGHELDERSLVERLRAIPDSIILVDWKTNGMTNLGVLKRALDSRCGLPHCDGVTRNAAMFVIGTGLTEGEFLNIPGGVDLAARISKKGSTHVAAAVTELRIDEAHDVTVHIHEG